MKESYSCGQPHDPELDWVIWHQKMDPQKACRAWQKGKRVYNVCRFLVNKEGYEERSRDGNPLPKQKPRY
jgi:hypothetical protein